MHDFKAAVAPHCLGHALGFDYETPPHPSAVSRWPRAMRPGLGWAGPAFPEAWRAPYANTNVPCVHRATLSENLSVGCICHCVVRTARA